MESHKQILLRLFKRGEVMTSIKGYTLGIVQTTNRINELIRDGYDIEHKRMVSKKGKRYNAYFMPAFFDKTRLV